MRRLLGVLLVTAQVGCSVSDEGRAPPDDILFFPTGVAVDPTGRWAFVTNGNTDLRFNGGSLAVLDLQAAFDLEASGGCTERDPSNALIPICPLGQIIQKDRTVRIGSFGGQPKLQRFFKPRLEGGRPVGLVRQCTPSGPADCHCDPEGTDPACVPQFDVDEAAGFRLLIPVRSDPSMTWVNVSEGGMLDCGQGAGVVPRCDDAHRVNRLASDKDTVLAPEPFSVAVNESLGIAVTAHLFAAAVGLYDLGDTPDQKPLLVDQRGSGLDASSAGGRSAFGAAFRPVDPLSLPSACPGGVACSLGDFTQLFVTSRVSPRIGQLIPRGAELCRPMLSGDTCIPREPTLDAPCADARCRMSLIAGPQVHLETYLIDGGDVRDIVFNRAGTRAYVVDRRPPTLLEIDTSPNPPPSGEPLDIILRAVEVCSEPSLVALREDADPLRVYVSCFGAGQIYVIDPARGVVVDVIDVGRGPNAIVQAGQFGVVTNFADNNLSIVDLRPGSASENRVLFKIGAPRPITSSR